MTQTRTTLLGFALAAIATTLLPSQASAQFQASLVDADSSNVAISCGEYHTLTGLDMCHIQTDVPMSAARYRELLEAPSETVCQRRIKKRFGTLDCGSLRSGFQAWRNEDRMECARSLSLCNADVTVEQVHLSTERDLLPSLATQFQPLGRAERIRP